MFMKFLLALIVPLLNLGAYAPQITQHVNADYASSTAFIIIGRHSPQGSLFVLAWGIIASYCRGSLYPHAHGALRKRRSNFICHIISSDCDQTNVSPYRGCESRIGA
jgi:hypothetical protein